MKLSSKARLIIPPVSHITFMDIFLLASVLTVMATIFQSAVIKVLVQRRALYDISRHGRDTDIQNNVGNEVERGLRALRRRFRKSQTATSLFGTLFKYTTNVSIPPRFLCGFAKRTTMDFDLKVVIDIIH